jgi:mycoredoxin
VEDGTPTGRLGTAAALLKSLKFERDVPDRTRRHGPMATSAARTMTMYSTSWCGYCRRLKSQLDREGIVYAEVDIESHPEAAEFVMQVNNGNQTVPTVLFPDGTAATNPSLAEVKARLLAA